MVQGKRKWVGDKCVIDIDGKNIEPIAYMSYAPLKENFDEIKARGVRLFMFPIYAGDEGINMESGLRPLCDNFFKGYGEYDFSINIPPTMKNVRLMLCGSCLTAWIMRGSLMITICYQIFANRISLKTSIS